MKPKLNRRDFLKLGLLVGLSNFKFPANWEISSFQTSDGENQSKPNILIIVLDALSATNMSLYGYPRQTTPHIERFANRATVFHNHFANGSFTTSGTASLLTGTYPWTHRAFHMNGTLLPQFADRTLFSLFDADYYTMFYTHNPLVRFLISKGNPFIDDYTDIEQLCILSQRFVSEIFANDANLSYWGETRLTGYDTFTPDSMFLSILDKYLYQSRYRRLTEKYAQRFPNGLAHNYNKQVFLLEEAIDWIAAQAAQAPQPFLGYYHLYPPHDPYALRSDFINFFKDDWLPSQKPESVFTLGVQSGSLIEQRRRYDEYLAYADSEFGRLVRQLEKSGLLETTILVLTSDHGELFERGILGHLTPVMFQPVLRIPLIISTPGQTQRLDVDQPTCAVDVLPTLLALTGQEIPQWVEGQVLPPFNEINSNPGRSIFAVDAKKSPKKGALNVASVALIRYPFKLIRIFGYPEYPREYELYDIENDPEELNDLYPQKHPIAEALKAELLAKLDQVNEPYLD
jgi:arylsulfatase A-like enzyme